MLLRHAASEKSLAFSGLHFIHLEIDRCFPGLSMISNVTFSWCVKAKVLVTQLCLTLPDPVDCSPPGSSVHEILQTRILDWVVIPLPGIFLGSNQGLLHCRQILSHLSHQMRQHVGDQLFVCLKQFVCNLAGRIKRMLI